MDATRITRNVHEHIALDSQKLFALLFHRARRRIRAEVQLDFDEPRRARLSAVLPDVRLAQVKLRAEVGERDGVGILKRHRLDARQDHVFGCAREMRDARRERSFGFVTHIRVRG